jgi:hypothetical protein
VRARKRGRSLGPQAWVRQTAARLGLELTLRGPGRPKRVAEMGLISVQGRPARERPKQAHPIDGKANAKTYRVPTPHGFGQTSVPLFVSGGPALLVPSSGTRFRVPPSGAGAPARKSRCQ